MEEREDRAKRNGSVGKRALHADHVFEVRSDGILHRVEAPMNVVLTAEMERFIEERLQRGRYPSPEDVVRAGFASLAQQEAIEGLSSRELEAVFPDIRARIAQGLEEARAGKLTDG